MSSDSAPIAAASDSRAGRPGPERLFLQLAVLLLAVWLPLAAIVMWVPAGNDYALATTIKHARLAQAAPRKIVLVGGSNLMFGIDSTELERRTGTRVVNMGLNGYLGVRYMLEEVKPALNASDVVVLSFEYDNFFKSVDGGGTDLLIILKANPSAVGYFSPWQLIKAAGAAPRVAQGIVVRLLDEVSSGVSRSIQGPLAKVEGPQTATDLIMSIESAAGINEYGDLISHLSVDWPYPREDGLELLQQDAEVVSLLQEFAEAMQARGVTVVLSYTPAIQYYYARYSENLQRLHRALSAAAPLVVPSAPETFVYDEPLFFDTVYHLNREGRAIRTARVFEDLKRSVPDL